MSYAPLVFEFQVRKTDSAVSSNMAACIRDASAVVIIAVYCIAYPVELQLFQTIVIVLAGRLSSLSLIWIRAYCRPANC